MHQKLIEHAFGGIWTQRKLTILADYLAFFPLALKDKPFKLVYIDTFAGTGKCTIKVEGGTRTIDGSARIALDVARPFDEYIFIERRTKHVKALEELKANHPQGSRVAVWHGDARQHMADVLAQHNWKRTRGVLLLDPYGLQCTWEMVERIASTKALDVFFLVSVAGISRQAARDASKQEAEKALALDAFLGTTSWRDALYSPPRQEDFFTQAGLVREDGTQAIVEFVRDRMRTAFPHVEEPVILRNSTNAALYAFFFAVSNPSGPAIALASRVGRDILSKLA